MSVECRAPVPPPIVVPKVSSGVVVMDEFLPNVYSPPKRTKVVLFSSNATPLPAQQKLSKCCVDAGYPSEVMTSPAELDKLLSDDHANEIIVVLPVRYPLEQDTQNVLSLAKSDLPVVVIAILLSHSTMDEDMISLTNSGVTRILTTDEAQWKLTHEVRLAERNELRLKRIQLFARALMEGVENSHDAIQVTTRESRIMYVNRSFCDLNGYPREECLGRLASDMLHAQDGKMLLENGKRHAEYRKEPWEGDILGRRKSGSLVRQHFKLLPVRSNSGLTTHHVTVQRLVSNHEFIAGMSSPKLAVHPELFPGGRVTRSSLGNVTPLGDTPLMRTINLLNIAREMPNCPPDVKEMLDKCCENLRAPSGLHLPVVVSSSHHSRGIVEGLLNNGRRFRGSESARFMALLDTDEVREIREPNYDPDDPEIARQLNKLATWDFDIVSVERLCDSLALHPVAMAIFTEFNVCDTLRISPSLLSSWIKMMEANYRCENSYHNATHAADVLQATAFLIRGLNEHPESLLKVPMGPLEIASVLISATIHDLGHPGRTNPFLCNSGSKLSLLYNDRAVLENHHVAFFFRLTVNDERYNIFQNIDASTYQTLRAVIIDLVLATDMASHFEHLSKFTSSSIFGPEEPSVPGKKAPNLASVQCEGRQMMKRVLLKCADIANACRPEKLCETWAKRIAEEYFQQTEDEKALGLPIVFPDFDRATCKLPVTQVKFIDYFVVGLFDVWNMLCPIPDLITNLTHNHAFWQNQIEPSSDTSSSSEEGDDFEDSG